MRLMIKPMTRISDHELRVTEADESHCPRSVGSLPIDAYAFTRCDYDVTPNRRPEPKQVRGAKLKSCRPNPRHQKRKRSK